METTQKLHLKNLGDSKETSNKQEVRYCCPFCEDENFKLYVNIQKGIYHCQKCKTSGRLDGIEVLLDNFKEKIMAFLNPKKEKVELPVDIKYPEGFQRLYPDSGRPYFYIKRRKITDLQIQKYHIGYCEEDIPSKFRGRIIFPIFNDHKKLIYYVGRDYMDSTYPKYLNCQENKDQVIFKSFTGKVEQAILVEGIIDALATENAGFNVIGMLGKEPTSKQIIKILESCSSAIICLDPDANKYAMKLAKRLAYYIPVKLAFLDTKDPGSSTTQELKTTIERSK